MAFSLLILLQELSDARNRTIRSETSAIYFLIAKTVGKTGHCPFNSCRI